MHYYVKINPIHQFTFYFQPTGGETPTRHSGQDPSLETLTLDEPVDKDLDEKVRLGLKHYC